MLGCTVEIIDQLKGQFVPIGNAVDWNLALVQSECCGCNTVF